MISNCGHDESGRYSGGKAGDQTGSEWEIRPWYNRPWTYVIRHPVQIVRKQIAQLAVEAANNNRIGYDQAQRYTFWQRLRESGYHPANITAYCETDCSAGVAAIVKATGYILGIDALKKVPETMYTGNEKEVLKKAGFDILNTDKYLASDRYLVEGDILLCEGHHTAINLTDGLAAESEWHWVYAGGEWYYQDADGRNSYGWKLIKETNGTARHWYWFNSVGKMVTDWQQIDGKWYYFEPSGSVVGALYRSDDNGAQSVWYVI